MGKINAQWHAKNKMPPKATFGQRVKWHERHAKKCGCRSGDMPADIKKALATKKSKA